MFECFSFTLFCIFASFSAGAREAEMPIVNKIASAMVCIIIIIIVNLYLLRVARNNVKTLKSLWPSN